MFPISAEWTLAIFLGLLVPLLLYCWNLSSKQSSALTKLNELTDMHENTNRLIDQHMQDEKEMHSHAIRATEKLTRSIDQLSHFTQWLGTVTDKDGNGAPPYVAKP